MLRIYFTCYAFCAFVNALASFALSIWIYQTTNSIMAFTSAGIAFLVPVLILSPAAGYLVDKIGIKSAIVGSSFAISLGWLALAICVWQIPVIWSILPILALIGAFTSLQMPAYHSLIAASVESDKLTQFNGVLGGVTALTGVVAPVAAGYFYSKIDMPILCALPFFMFLAQSYILLKLTPDHLEDTQEISENELGTPLQVMKRVLLFLGKSKSLVALLILGLFVNTFAESAGVVLTPLGLDMFDEARVGLLVTIAALGALVGNILLSVFPISSNKVLWIVSLNLAQSFLLIVVVTLTPLTFISLSVGIALFFILEAIYDGIDLSYWQERAPTNYRASLLSFKTMVSVLTMILGYLSVPVLLGVASVPAVNINLLTVVEQESQAANLLAASLAIVGIANVFVVVIFALLVMFRGTFRQEAASAREVSTSG